MKIHIVSNDGIPYNTRMFEQETGEEIEGIVAAFIHPFNTASKLITGEITVLATSVDIVMDADVHLQCPYCSHSFPVEAEDPIHTTVAKQDAENQVHMEDHLSKATWPYGEKSGEFLRDAVQKATKEMQEKLEKAYMDVQKDPAKRIVGIDIETEVEMVAEHPGEGRKADMQLLQTIKEIQRGADDVPVIHFNPLHHSE